MKYCIEKKNRLIHFGKNIVPVGIIQDVQILKFF